MDHAVSSDEVWAGSGPTTSALFEPRLLTEMKRVGTELLMLLLTGSTNTAPIDL